MLKRKALNRIFITTIAVFIVVILSSFSFLYENKKNIYDNNNYKTNYKEGIYTLNKDNYISKTYIYVDKELTTLEKIKVLMETMINDNNKNALLPSYFKPILPSNTKILSVLLENRIIKINFSKEILNITEEQSEKMIEAIIYTLTDISDIDGVEIYIEEELLKFIPHTNKELNVLLTKDFGINKKYEITSNKNINKVILYFLGSNNNYIPITKYVNNTKEKLEIIIESLIGYNYYNNLISLVNSNLELKYYNFDEKSCLLEFNSISKEEAELISYAIFANYDVESIVFMENNNKIYEKSKKNIE